MKRLVTMFGALAFAAAVLVQPASASTTLAKHATASASERAEKAAQKATLWIPGAGAVVHFHDGEGKVFFGYYTSGTDSMRNESWSRIDQVFLNTDKKPSDHSPDAVLAVSTGGSLIGQIEFEDLIAVEIRHGKMYFLAQYRLGSRVLGIPVENVKLAGKSIDVTYLTWNGTEALCCPSVPNHITLKYDGGLQLKRQPK